MNVLASKPIRRLAAAVIAFGGLAIALPTTAYASSIHFVGSCPAESHRLTPRSSHTLGDGGLAIDYQVDGIEQEQLIPPQDFSPFLATNRELKTYGFPTKPPVSAESRYASWSRVASAYKGARVSVMCIADRLIGAGNQRSGRAKRSGPINNTMSQSYNWSGMVAPQGAPAEGNVPFHYVQGQWAQTIYGNCGCTEPSDESTWVGIGGYHHNSYGQYGLIQDGSDMYGTQEANSWYEYLYPCSGSTKECGVSELAGPSIPGNDTVFAETYWDGSAAHFVVTDNGYQLINTKVSLPISAFDGGNAEWINERPTWDGSYYLPLTNYRIQYWQNASACQYATPGSVCNGVAYFSPAYVEMTSDGGWYTESCGNSKILAFPNALGHETFQSNWCRAQ